jgi:hypothetical protein
VSDNRDDQNRAAALHEATHAVAAVAVGYPVRELWIEDAFGYCVYRCWVGFEVAGEGGVSDSRCGDYPGRRIAGGRRRDRKRNSDRPRSRRGWGAAN